VPETKLKVLIVDDHAVVREGLKSIVTKAADLQVGGEASTASEAVGLLRRQAFDLVLLDISLPDKTGVQLLTIIRTEFPKLPVLVLSVYPEDQYALRMLRQGAAGYLTKESAPELLITAIRKVVSGGRYVSPTLAEKLAEGIVHDTGRPVHDLLSDREFEIFRLIAAGKSLTEIGESLHVSIKTVSTYRSRILEKTGFKTNADLTRYALQQGLIN